LRVILIILGVLSIGYTRAQIPNFDRPDRLDVLTWNIEWFGDGNNGPSNDQTQLTNSANLINSTNCDIIGLCEISNVNYWNSLLSLCSDYSGVISTWSQTQKTALLFKKSEYDLVYSKHILEKYEYEFGGGRLPLEVCLVSKNKNKIIDTLRVWVLHMKANTGSTSSKITAYNRRYDASILLKSYISSFSQDMKGLVIGDWNDDFDESILSGYSTPFGNWLKDTNYTVSTYNLTMNGDRSTAGYPNMIDHIVASPGLKGTCVLDSSSVLYANNWISGFSNNTSDHYPVYSKFVNNNKSSNSLTEFPKKYHAFYRDNLGHWMLDGKDIGEENCEIYSISGIKRFSGKLKKYQPYCELVVIKINNSIYKYAEHDAQL